MSVHTGTILGLLLHLVFLKHKLLNLLLVPTTVLGRLLGSIELVLGLQVVSRGLLRVHDLFGIRLGAFERLSLIPFSGLNIMMFIYRIFLLNL